MYFCLYIAKTFVRGVFSESPVKDTWYSSFVSVFLGFHCSDNGFDQGRARGSGISGGGGGGGSVTGNFVKDTGIGNSGVGGSGIDSFRVIVLVRAVVVVMVVLVLMLAVTCDQRHFQKLS